MASRAQTKARRDARWAKRNALRRKNNQLIKEWQVARWNTKVFWLNWYEAHCLTFWLIAGYAALAVSGSFYVFWLATGQPQ